MSLKGHESKTEGWRLKVRQKNTNKSVEIYTYIHFTDADVVTHESQKGQRFCSDIWTLCLAIWYSFILVKRKKKAF